jgi:hypothetical protein
VNLSNFQVARKLSSSLSLFPKNLFLKFKIGSLGLAIVPVKYGVMSVFRAKNLHISKMENRSREREDGTYDWGERFRLNCIHFVLPLIHELMHEKARKARKINHCRVDNRHAGQKAAAGDVGMREDVH